MAGTCEGTRAESATGLDLVENLVFEVACPLCCGLGHGRDDALFHQDAGFGAVLERLLGRPFRPDWQSQRFLILHFSFKRMREA